MAKIDIEKLKLTHEQEEVYIESMKSIARHNQAAIHLVTSGGKSYILAKILYTLKKEAKKRKLSVLYISTSSSCTNFLQSMSDDFWGDTISVVNYTQLQRDEKYVNTLNKKRVDIIVIDEAHHALAPKTYEGIKYTEEKYPNATIIAMSANNRRYSDKKMVFELLTPKLTLGVDYQNRGLKVSVANKQICDFEYKSCDIARLKKYCAVFDILQERASIYIDARDTITRAKDLIEQYKSNAFIKLREQMREDLKELHIDGKDGDRWFVFFNTIKELRESISSIGDMFKFAYNNNDINIIIHEFHNENPDAEKISTVLTGDKATPTTVDIIMTCLKGGESFHPENTRGIIMNRKSNSETVVVQQLGRTLQIKELCDDCKLIYDLVGNTETIDITQTIFNGKESPEDRDIISIFENELDNNKLMESLENAYGDCGSYSTIEDNDLEDILSEFEDYKDRIEHLIYAQIIADIIAQYKIDNHEDCKNTHPVYILKKYEDEVKLKGKYSLASAFLTIQKLFIQGYFGEYTMDNVPTDSDFYKVYNLLGDDLYRTPRCSENATWKDDNFTEVESIKLGQLIDIASEVKKYNYDYRSISHTKDLKAKITRLRQLNLEGRLSESYQKYCKRNKIDIDGIYSNIIKEVINLDDAEKFPNMVKSFKQLSRMLNNIESESTTGDWCVNDHVDDLYNIFARYYTFVVRFNTHCYGKQCIIALKLRYKNVISLSKKLVSKEELENIINDIRVTYKIKDIIKNKSNDYVKGDSELYVMKLAKRNEDNRLGEFEEAVLEYIGIKEFRGKRDKYINELLEHTEFGVQYKKLIETNSITAYNILMQYDFKNIPSFYRKQINSRKFKQSSSNAKQNQLLSKDCTEIKELVSQLLFADEDKITELKELVKSKEFDTRNLLKYAIPEKLYSFNKVYVDEALTNGLDNVSKDTYIAIQNMVKEDEYGTMGMIVCNLSDAGLLPDSVNEFAQICMGK